MFYQYVHVQKTSFGILKPHIGASVAKTLNAEENIMIVNLSTWPIIIQKKNSTPIFS